MANVIVNFKRPMGRIRGGAAKQSRLRQASRGLPTPKNIRRGDYVAKSPPVLSNLPSASRFPPPKKPLGRDALLRYDSTSAPKLRPDTALVRQ